MENEDRKLDTNKLDLHIQVVESQVTEEEVIEEIVDSGKVADAFYVCDVSDIVEKHRHWEHVMTRIQPYYAVKCNSHRIVLETLAALGTCFDCASKGEIRRVISLGVSPDRIIYAHPAKKINHLLYAAEVGVTTMTFDNECEMYKIKKYYPEAKLVLRIRYDDPTATFHLGEKFGAYPEDAKQLLAVARYLDLNVIGVSFHIGSSRGHNPDLNAFHGAIIAARTVFDEADDLGFHFTLLDIGGGFCGNKGATLYEVGAVINDVLDRYFPETNIDVIAEPGQYYVNSAFTLITQVHTKKVLNGQEIARMYFTDVSVYNSMIDVVFKVPFDMTPVKNRKPNSRKLPSIVWGATCCSNDKISGDIIYLPELYIGDWLMIHDIGAYSISISSDFNGFPLPNVHAFIRKDDWVYLTEKIEQPVPKEKFVFGDSTDKYLLTGLTLPSRYTTNYF
ncbi:unnamed protein product [Acanthoscelides obtectus]|uniref:ornithine decarboxylase n=1 Tax=Acanthoscelides obtectus TaxID=200917 RepID=A0A9P0MHT2_ACAOB|nr:unnamed protein product [Acanthoscelides obtectus]CAK1671587.1 Ornithine decarboxylase [Acanthoscelides obtectus]